MANVVVILSDAEAALLAGEHGDVAEWLRGTASNHATEIRRRILDKWVRALSEEDPAFVKSLFDLVQSNPRYLPKEEPSRTRGPR